GSAEEPAASIAVDAGSGGGGVVGRRPRARRAREDVGDGLVRGELKMKRIAILVCILLAACGLGPQRATGASSYLDNSGRDDVLTGGVKMIPIHTPKGDFHVW